MQPIELNSPFKDILNQNNIRYNPYKNVNNLNDFNNTFKPVNFCENLQYQNDFRNYYRNKLKINNNNNFQSFNFNYPKGYNCKNSFINYIKSLNNLFGFLSPFKRIQNFNNLSIELPILIIAFFLILKLLFSKRLSFFYIILLIILPICSYILIDKIIIEKYFNLRLIRFKKLLFFDYFRLFFTAYLPSIIFFYLTFIINLKSKIGFITYCLSIFYSSHIACKLLFEFILSKTILDRESNKIYLTVTNKDKKNIYIIYLIIYYLINHILNS